MECQAGVEAVCVSAAAAVSVGVTTAAAMIAAGMTGAAVTTGGRCLRLIFLHGSTRDRAAV